MIELTPHAQDYFRQLLEQQGDDDFDIRIGVSQPGTPAANVELGLCEPDDLAGNETALPCEGFTLYVQADSSAWLDDARVDFDPEQGRMRISAPGLRGEVPEENADLAAKIRYVIESEINPQLASHSGQVQLVDIEPDNVVVLEFGGGCHGCGMVDVTLKQGVEKTLRKRLPDVSGVRDATEHATGKNPYYRKRGEGASAMT